MKLTDFDFDLPDTLVAVRPMVPRDQARMLCVGQGGALLDRQVCDLPSLLQPGDVLVLNDTRVIPARLKGRRRREASSMVVEATLHRRLSPNRWAAFMRPAKRLLPGDRVEFGDSLARGQALRELRATVEAKGDGGEIILAFDLAGLDLDAAIETQGQMPLPPYIAAKRAEDEQDRRDYQTIYARSDGSVAAPTAGLHFTPDLMRRLEGAGVGICFVTLHVGAGTFLPVKSDNLADHHMHSEYGEVSAQACELLNTARKAGGRIVCVGTTSLRLLESATGDDGIVRPFAAETSIFITPGYRFRASDGLLTNFHLPKSTLFVLVSALAGLDVMRRAYDHAISTGYRFYSYGDTSLIWKPQA